MNAYQQLVNKIIRAYLLLDQIARDAGLPPEVRRQLSEKMNEAYALFRQFQVAVTERSIERVVYLVRALLTHYRQTVDWFRTYVRGQAEFTRRMVDPMDLWGMYQRVRQSPETLKWIGIGALVVGGGLALFAISRARAKGRAGARALAASYGISPKVIGEIEGA